MRDVNILLYNGVNVEKSLELFGDMSTYDETLEEFLNDIDEKIKNLTSFKEIADMGNYAILVHSLKSDFRYFGFDKLGDVCFKHETESKANNIYYIYENFNELIKEIKNAVRIISDYLGKEHIIEIEREQSVRKSSDTILVVDDSNVIQNFVHKIFDDKYQVLTASNGNEAINLIMDNNEYNIIGMLLDLNMPQVDGFAVLHYFEKENLFDKIPVSIITGVWSDDLINKAGKYPIVDILRKPFNERDIKVAIDKFIK